MGIVLQGGMVVTDQGQQVCDVRMVGEKIVAMGTGIFQAGDISIDATDCFVMPGGIDPHTHFDLDVGSTRTADDFSSGTQAALMGGTTTIIDFATQDNGGTLRDALQAWHDKAAGACYTDYGFHMAITDWNDVVATQMAELSHELGIPSFKLYMAYKHSLQVDDGVIVQALRRSNEVGALVSLHCENGDVIDMLVNEALRQGYISPAYHARTRPALVEAEAVQRAIALAEMAQAPLYIVHLSSAAALQKVVAAKSKGLEVYVETCPQYLLLDERRYETTDFSAAKYVMSPPLRTQSDQEALWQGLQSGLVSVVATDHCSFCYAGQKELGRHDFSKIPNGIPGVETRMSLLYTYGVETCRITMQQYVALTSTNAAKILGLYPQKGTIEVGSDADLVVWDRHVSSVIRAQTQTQRVDYTPYEGFALKGQARHVFLRGQQVVKDAKLCELLPSGKYIIRQPKRDISKGKQVFGVRCRINW